MNKITQEEFDAIPRVGGIKYCPANTDYSNISSFGKSCRFGEWCSFGELCSFGEWCSFGERCRFGKDCSFGQRCSFGEWCGFGKSCSFGEWCGFGEWCSFGKSCSFENGKETRSANPYFAVDRIGSQLRKTYFFDFKGGVFIRAGCFGGYEHEFIKKLELDNDPQKTKTYMAALALAKLQLGITKG